MTAANFQTCLAFTLKYEGGGSDDPRDPGGRTMEGVTQATYDAYCNRKGMALSSVYNITAAERDDIYRNEYWNLVNGDALRPGEDLCVFDFAVNSGPARALDVWRRIVPAGSSWPPASGVIHSICAYRLSFLHALQTWRYFAWGWGRRVAACEAMALQMAGVPLQGVLDRAKNQEARHGATGSVVAGAGAAGTAILHHVSNAGGLGVAAFAGVAILAAVLFAFASSRHGQRADALASAIKNMQARANALKEAQAAEVAQKNALRRQIENQQQQIKSAEATEASIQSALLQSNPPTGNAEAKK
ncbi:MAG: glycosyl hydrolase 108 family protein [Methylocella sp.]